jgi:hypothetical protein
MFRNKLGVLHWWVVSPPPNPQAGGPSPVGCPRLLIQYIRCYPPYLEAVSSIRNLRTRHAVVTRNPLNMGFQYIFLKSILILSCMRYCPVFKKKALEDVYNYFLDVVNRLTGFILNHCVSKVDSTFFFR